jgi:hypothetical protein
MKVLFAAAVLLGLLAGCAAPGGYRLQRVQVDAKGSGFVAGQTWFVPWGFNYDRDYRMRLLEDYWEAEWPTVEQDFREMRALGANVVRVHLQFGRFMESPTRPNRQALTRLSKLLHLAERNGLRLDLTGLACYRKADVPQWYDALDEAGRWEAQANFWRAVAGVGRNSPAVFCYDLMNEPIVPEKSGGDWLVGELAGFWYVQSITLDPAGRDRMAIAEQWVSLLVGAIRETDPTALITVGLLPNSHENPGSGFSPGRVGKHLDFIAVHVYPAKAKIQDSLDLLKHYQVGKPVVIEEMFPLNCSMGEFEEFLKRTRATGSAEGWIGFYWGQTPDDLAKENTIAAGLTAQWLDLFRKHRPLISETPPEP